MGCHTYVAMDFHNGSNQKITVRESLTGETHELSPNEFAAIGHSHAPIIVTGTNGVAFQYDDVNVADPAFYPRYRNVSTLGTRLDINVLLSTNLELYILLPGRDSVDSSVSQPEGYPKKGHPVEK
jgi:hypothetical protein